MLKFTYYKIIYGIAQNKNEHSASLMKAKKYRDEKFKKQFFYLLYFFLNQEKTNSYRSSFIQNI